MSFLNIKSYYIWICQITFFRKRFTCFFFSKLTQAWKLSDETDQKSVCINSSLNSVKDFRLKKETIKQPRKLFKHKKHEWRVENTSHNRILLWHKNPIHKSCGNWMSEGRELVAEQHQSESGLLFYMKRWVGGEVLEGDRWEKSSWLPVPKHDRQIFVWGDGKGQKYNVIFGGPCKSFLVQAQVW